jgi:hypothetical protein
VLVNDDFATTVAGARAVVQAARCALPRQTGVAALVQGLLSMHALLENPFGQHPGKFPLRAYAIDHIRQTNAMLKDPADREPEVMRSIFHKPPPTRTATKRTGDLATLAREARPGQSDKLDAAEEESGML